MGKERGHRRVRPAVQRVEPYANKRAIACLSEDSEKEPYERDSTVKASRMARVRMGRSSPESRAMAHWRFRFRFGFMKWAKYFPQTAYYRQTIGNAVEMVH